MKFKMALTGLLLAVLALTLAACRASPATVPFQLSYEDFTKNKALSWDAGTVNAGDTLKITLPSNPSTGFKWGVSTMTAATLAQDGESEYIVPDGKALGAYGQEVWTFKAVKTGAGRIDLGYSRPWEGGEKGEWTLSIAVNVK